jgi:hypothetical protein
MARIYCQKFLEKFWPEAKVNAEAMSKVEIQGRFPVWTSSYYFLVWPRVNNLLPILCDVYIVLILDLCTYMINIWPGAKVSAEVMSKV